MSENKQKKDIYIGLVVTPNEKESLKKMAEKKDLPMATILRMALREFIENHKEG